MKDQKQNDEKAKIISDICPFFKEYGSCEKCDDMLECDPPCYFECVADVIIKNEYRKQSGWVSVEDRLPEREGIYLIYTISGHIRLGEFRPYFMGDEPQFDPYTTHWMPLPEPPKGE